MRIKGSFELKQIISERLLCFDSISFVSQSEALTTELITEPARLLQLTGGYVILQAPFPERLFFPAPAHPQMIFNSSQPLLMMCLWCFQLSPF